MKHSISLVRKRGSLRIVNNGGSNRWASSFVIFPQNRMAGVALGSDETSVIVGPDAYSMKVSKAGPVTFHYLLGDMPTIYKRYLALRTQAGYPNIKPKFRLFELGWETWASLGWRANAATVQEELSRLLSLGFQSVGRSPVPVSGSKEVRQPISANSVRNSQILNHSRNGFMITT